jgi:DNA-binding PadR family transcriptional regulator
MFVFAVTVYLLILHAVQRGEMHGYAIAQSMHLFSDEVLKVQEGSLYPALYWLELDGAVTAKWESQRIAADPVLAR